MPKSKIRSGQKAKNKNRLEQKKFHYKKLESQRKLYEEIDKQAQVDALHKMFMEQLENHDNGTKVIEDEEYVKSLRPAVEKMKQQLEELKTIEI